MRRELAIKVDVLDADRQEELKQRSSQQLIGPWAIDENETLAYGSDRSTRARGRSTDDRSASLPLAAGRLRAVPRAAAARSRCIDG